MKNSLILAAMLFSFSAATAKAQVVVKPRSCVELNKAGTVDSKKAAPADQKLTLDQWNKARAVLLMSIMGVGYTYQIYCYFQSPYLVHKILGCLHSAHVGIMGIMAVKAYLLYKKQKDGRRRIIA